jgi:general secretion pathway protein G
MKTIRHRRPRSGFTLVEMLVVLAILVLLVSMVVPRIIGSQKRADINAAKAQIGLFKSVLEKYALDCKKFPTTEQGLSALVSKPADLAETATWDGPYVSGDIPKDPWGHEYQYEYPPSHGRGENPDIWSFGPDGEENSEDDITSWGGGTGGSSDDKAAGDEKRGEGRRPKARETRSTEPRGTSDRNRETPAPSRGTNRPAPRSTPTEKKAPVNF